MTAAEFFSQPGGFLAQTLPIALLCFAPFGDSELKFPRRRILLFLTAGLILLSAGYGAIALALSALLTAATTCCALRRFRTWESACCSAVSYSYSASAPH